MSGASVVPIGRDDGYYLVEGGVARFVPFDRPTPANVIPFPKRAGGAA